MILRKHYYYYYYYLSHGFSFSTGYLALWVLSIKSYDLRQCYRFQLLNDNGDNNGLNIPHSGNSNHKFDVFLEHVSYFKLDIMVTKNSYVDEEGFLFISFLTGVVSGLVFSRMRSVWMLKSHKT